MTQKLLKISTIVFLTALMQHSFLIAQPAGNIRGVVTDGTSGKPLPFVTVFIINSEPLIGTTSDEKGNFRLTNLPIGRYDIKTTFIGYEPAVFREIMVGSGKEVFLEVTMRENVHLLEEIVVRAKVNKEEPLNPMALASARMLSVEEASRYAGGLDDPARLVTAFAGVSGGLGSNGISIRGNSPAFLQWRLEGSEAVNPTHFSDITGIGGGVLTAMSSNVLGNSDFFTGAFPAEYGNALSGVFDIQLRNGNNQNYEHTIQVGSLGLEFTSEGPFEKGKQASYLINYRYSTFGLVGDLFPEMAGEIANARYQDLTFKMNFPTKKAGTFTVWGTAIKDHFLENEPEDTTKWMNYYEHYAELVGLKADFWQTKAIGGTGHKIFISEKSYLKSALVANYTQNKIEGVFVYPRHKWETFDIMDMENTNWNVAYNTFLNTKFNASHTNRTGISITGLFFNMDYSMCPDIYDLIDYPPKGGMVNFTKDNGNSMVYSAFSQSIFRLNSRLTTNIGLHGTYFRLTEKTSIEPRVSIRWQALPLHALGFAYGKHSRRENTDYYFIKTPKTRNELVNKNLDFAKAHHFVISYDWSITENLRFKLEPYYQYLYDIPVAKGSYLSIINYYDFMQMLPALVNDGKGKNYGIDATIERYLNSGYYYLLTGSLFDSRYLDGEGIWRNTRLNRKYIVNTLGGKEWNIGKQKHNILNVSLRFTVQGGERYIPADEIESKNQKKVVYDYSRAWEEQNPAEILCHFTVGYKINRKKVSHQIALQMMNLTGNKEYYWEYDYREDKPIRNGGTGTIPNLYYKLEF